MRTACWNCIFTLSLLVPAVLFGADELPPEWRFAGRFQGQPVAVLEIRAGNLPQRRKELYAGKPKTPTEEKAQALTDAFPTTVTAAVWALGPHDSDLRFVVDLNCPGKAPALGELISGLLPNDGPPPAQARVGTRTVTLPDRTELTLLVERDRIVLGHPEKVKEFLAAAPGAPFPWLKESVREVSLGVTEKAFAMRVGVDLSSIPAAVRSSNFLAPILKVFGVDQVPMQFCGEMVLDEQRLSLRIVSPLQGPVQGLVGLLFPEPQPLALVDRIPGNAPLALFLPWKKWDSVLAAVAETEKRWGDDVGKEFQEELDEIKRDWGFDLGADLLSRLGPGAVMVSLRKAQPERVTNEDGLLDLLSTNKDKPNVLLVPCSAPNEAEKLLAKAQGAEPGLPRRWQNGVLQVGEAPYQDRFAADLKEAGPNALLGTWAKQGRKSGLMVFFNARSFGASFQQLIAAGAQESAVLAKRYPPAAIKLTEHLARDGGVLVLDAAGGPRHIQLTLEWLDTDPLKFISQADAEVAEWLTTAK